MLYYLTDKEINRLLTKINLSSCSKIQEIIKALVYRKNFNGRMQDIFSKNRISEDEKRYPFL